MKSASIYFSKAQQVWSIWNQIPFAKRVELIESAANKLALPSLLKPLAFHKEHCTLLLSEPQFMPGPTGETNELYTAGRGVALIIADQSVTCECSMALFAQLSVALLAGNTLLVCVQDSELAEQVRNLIETGQLPNDVLNLVEYEQYTQLLDCDVRVVGVISQHNLAHVVNRKLAAKSGVIAPLIVESDVKHMPVALDSKLVLRFITERTRTINITAVGGNATLLELGAGGEVVV
ncbi:hypothetical protein [Vibrio gallicus]|uniref:hypothetical protein n=1 Tax=Vibrio gallicus TaxID=190897 RepID=UPI0021C3EF13|nr:hypothetical protein [Vibrio gallicus]